MIESIHFTNFKALRDTTLKLGRFTLLVGPNGCGKSTVLQGLTAVRDGAVQQDGVKRDYTNVVTVGVPTSSQAEVRVTLHWDRPFPGVETRAIWTATGHNIRHVRSGLELPKDERRTLSGLLSRIRVFNLEASAIARDVQLQPGAEIVSNGANVVVSLDQLRDSHPERFEAVNSEIGRWIPEFNRILFETPTAGSRRLSLRTSKGGHKINAADLSQGTLLALAMLTIAYLPHPPTLVGLEEPDRGIHPRLLRGLRDALYRLSNPEDFGEARDPVQVIATTHSPYLLDLFGEHADEVVLANRLQDNVQFQRLSDRSDLHTILQDSHLGDAWYTGILGGVPANT
jgi:predicted ATPase